MCTLKCIEPERYLFLLLEPPPHFHIPLSTTKKYRTNNVYTRVLNEGCEVLYRVSTEPTPNPMIHSGSTSTLIRCRSLIGSSNSMSNIINIHYGNFNVRRPVCTATLTRTMNVITQEKMSTAATTITTTATTAAAAAAAAKVATPQMLQGSNTQSLGKIIRHGRGDACITLNVGGKEFYTLRSTIAMNSVLSDHVVRAEQNHEIVRNGAVFIDRDPEHFPILLKYLRNRVEYETLRNYVDKTALKRIVKSFIDLPSDPKVLRELYIEAVFYRMKDLQDTLKDTSVLVQMASVISQTTGTGNPFDWIIKFWSQLRGLLVGMSVVGGSYMVAVQNEWNWILQRVGLQKKDRRTHSEIFE